jgi:hypothetical protein
MSYSVLSVHLSVAEPFGILPPLERPYNMRNSIALSEEPKSKKSNFFASLAQQIMVNGLLVQCKNLHCGPRTKNHPQSGILN